MRSIWVSAAVSLLSVACVSTGQLSANTESIDFSLDPISFRNSGIGFLTPVSATGQEADLSRQYKRMVDDYQATGIMERETLKRVGEVCGARYLGLLGSAEFSQKTNKRFGIGSMRLFDTKQASIRLSWKIWDSQSGAIAWEGSDEIHYAYDTSRERPVNFGFVAERAATNLIAELPLLAAAPVQLSSTAGSE